MQKIIGATTTHNGSKVRIVGVLKGAALASYDPDTAGSYITDDESLELAGGVTAADRIEVQAWSAREGRFSLASSDPRAIDLGGFGHMTH